MHYTALVGRHRFKSNRSSAVRDALGDPLREISERLVSAFLVARHVDEQVHAVAEFLGRDETHEELERPKRIPTTTDKQSRVVAVDIDDRAVDLFVVRLFEVDDCVDAHLFDEVFEHLGRDPGHVRRLLDESDPDFSGLAANAKDAGLAPANDVYFYFPALGV